MEHQCELNLEAPSTPAIPICRDAIKAASRSCTILSVRARQQEGPVDDKGMNVTDYFAAEKDLAAAGCQVVIVVPQPASAYPHLDLKGTNFTMITAALGMINDPFVSPPIFTLDRLLHTVIPSKR